MNQEIDIKMAKQFTEEEKTKMMAWADDLNNKLRAVQEVQKEFVAYLGTLDNVAEKLTKGDFKELDDANVTFQGLIAMVKG